MSGNSIRDTFFEECEELLEALVEGLSQMEESPGDSDVVNAVFRAVHSIKGGAGAFGLEELVNFAHTFETVMDKVRGNEIEVTGDLMALFHRSGDHLSDLVVAARDETVANQETEAALIKELEGHLGPDHVEEEFSFDALTLDFDAEPSAAIDLDDLDASADQDAERRFGITFTPTRALYDNGHEPLLLFDALAELGALSVSMDLAKLPDFDSFDPSEPCVSWSLDLVTQESETTLHEVFEFVEGLCAIDITVSEVPAHTQVEPADEEPATPAFDPPEETPMPEATSDDPVPAHAPADEIASPGAGSGTGAAGKEPRGPKPTLRVDLDRVDRLINTVGELIINQAMISQRIEELDLPTVAHLTNELEAYKLLARDIQEGVMAIRAQPVKPLFQRMSRIVREASDATGKKAGWSRWATRPRSTRR